MCTNWAVHVHQCTMRNYHTLNINAPCGTITNTYSHIQHQCTMRNYHKHIFTHSTSMHHEELSHTHSTSMHHEELSQPHIHTLNINAPWGTTTSTYSRIQHHCTMSTITTTYSHTQHQCTMRNYHNLIFTHSKSMHHEELPQAHIHTFNITVPWALSQPHIHTLNINAPWDIHTLIIKAPWGTITSTYSHTQHQCMRKYRKFSHSFINAPWDIFTHSSSKRHEEISQIFTLNINAPWETITNIYLHTQHQYTNRNCHTNV